MELGQTTQAVQKAIGRAMELRRWSLNKLAQEMKIHVTSLQRWKEGGTRSYDLDAVKRLFKLAELSMDEEFGLSRGHSDQSGPTDIDAILRERLPAVLGQLVLERSLPGAIAPSNPVLEQAEGVLERVRLRTSAADTDVRRRR
ncbi:helix-turn-helix transcriptional regulator [bacterium]|nr:helix-turn-helix transcriptional regulator [bacterium]